MSTALQLSIEFIEYEVSTAAKVDPLGEFPPRLD
jgi:hypothetical protein